MRGKQLSKIISHFQPGSPRSPQLTSNPLHCKHLATHTSAPLVRDEGELKRGDGAQDEHVGLQKSGHILQFSSVGERLGPPGRAAYAAAKFGVEGFSEVLAKEMAPLGVKVTIVEPGGFRTDFAGSSTTIRDCTAGPSMRARLVALRSFNASTTESNLETPHERRRSF